MLRRKNNLLEKLVLLRSNKLCLLALLAVGFFYRIYGLDANPSFWTDENHTAIFVRAILERGKPVLANGYSTGAYQWLLYWLGAISAKVFGLNEFAIRFPSVVFGVLTIWAVWLLGKELFTSEVYSPRKKPSTSEVFVPLIAALFITFLQIEILWSRQARPYQALQFFFVLGAWFLVKLAKKDKFEWKNFAGFLGCGILASLIHPLGLVILPVGLVYLLVWGTLNQNEFGSGQVLGVLGSLGALGVLGVFACAFRLPLFGLLGSLGKINNLFYYRVFLGHNYSLLGVLGVLGVLGQGLPVLFLMTQGIIVSFFLGQPFTRYFYPVFPFLVLLAAGGLGRIGEALGGKNKLFMLLTVPLLTLFVVGMSHKFTLFPKRVYSLNEDMQEIPEVDWKKIYNFVGEKLKQNPGSVLATNWSDLPVWYLGEGKPDFLVRKNVGAEKDIFSKAMILSDLDSFQELVKTKKKGLIIIDSWDNYIPDGVREYSRDNLKKELEIDRLYPVQPRYWPVEVYSWGF